eukprot:sb/3477445/
MGLQKVLVKIRNFHFRVSSGLAYNQKLSSKIANLRFTTCTPKRAGFYVYFSLLRPEGGVRGYKKSLSVSGPARRAGPDDVLRMDFVRAVLEKNEVNFCPKSDVNLIYP